MTKDSIIIQNETDAIQFLRDQSSSIQKLSINIKGRVSHELYKQIEDSLSETIEEVHFYSNNLGLFKYATRPFSKATNVTTYILLFKAIIREWV